MKITIYIFIALIMGGCTKDGVPDVADVNNIVIDGQPMTQTEFLQKYCDGKPENATCVKVLRVARQNSTRGKIPIW